MALNLPTERRAATATPWYSILPVANFSINSFDRGHIAGYYRPSVLANYPVHVKLYDEPQTRSITFDRPITHPRA